NILLIHSVYTIYKFKVMGNSEVMYIFSLSIAKRIKANVTPRVQIMQKKSVHPLSPRQSSFCSGILQKVNQIAQGGEQ
ncbi:hypothetical protein C5S53_09200, partial [Methanophagales archaeon]